MYSTRSAEIIPRKAFRLAAYAMLEFQKKSPSEMCLDSYIWEVDNPNIPEIKSLKYFSVYVHRLHI